MGALRLNNDFLRLVPKNLGANEKKCVSSYRFGFNGQEKDDEIHNVTGSMLNYKYRMYDSRIARFFAVDPLSSDYPMLTPYQHSSLNPIMNIELEGLEGTKADVQKAHDKMVLSVVNYARHIAETKFYKDNKMRNRNQFENGIPVGDLDNNGDNGWSYEGYRSPFLIAKKNIHSKKYGTFDLYLNIKQYKQNGYISYVDFTDLNKHKNGEDKELDGNKGYYVNFYTNAPNGVDEKSVYLGNLFFKNKDDFLKFKNEYFDKEMKEQYEFLNEYFNKESGQETKDGYIYGESEKL